MKIQEPIAQELIVSLNGETKDFAVKAARAVPASSAWAGIVIGLFWIGFISIFWFVFFDPVIQNKEVRFKVNGTPTVAGPGNMKPLVVTGIMIGLFTLIGVAIVGGSVVALIEPGPWFAGTASRLIILKKKSVRSVDWESFTGTTHLTGDAQSANITFEMRTGRMVSRKNGPPRYVPDKIQMAGIRDGIRIEEVCRRRIKENDPTPPNV